MKSVITPFLLLASLCATAQPVLEYAHVNLLGRTYPVHLVTNQGTADPTPNGPNLTWNFTGATYQMNFGTIAYVAPATTPQGASYPTADLAQVAISPLGTSYTYLNLTSSLLEILAEDVGTANPRIYTDPKTVLVFPYAYLNSFTDAYAYPGTTGSTTRVYSGYGTVILPTGTYTNVVKMTSSSGAINFFRSNPVEPLVQIESDGSAIVFGDATVTGVADLAQMPVLTVLPNPTTDKVQVEGLASGAQWQLADLQGRVLLAGSLRSGPLQLDLAGFAAGPYLLVAQDGTNRRAIRVVKQ